ncbi:MAG: hypothetical protein ACLSAF_15650 [Intestinimonas sp.]
MKLTGVRRWQITLIPWSVSDFTFPTDFENAPALLTGIFQDIWYAFGDYKILFVFPLTLAVCSVLVGRLSRSRSSSSAIGRIPDASFLSSFAQAMGVVLKRYCFFFSGLVQVFIF